MLNTISTHRFFTSLLLGTALAGAACDKGPRAGEPDPAPKVAAEGASAAGAKAPQEPSSEKAAVEGKTYGAGVTASESVAISEIVSDPEAFDGKTVRVEGMVTDVCVMRGCWFEVAGEAPGEKIRFKVNDGEMVFPVTAKGQRAVAQGKIVTQKLSLEETRAQAAYLAKEAGKEFDPESITEGQTTFRIEGTGAVIGDSK